MLEKLEQLPRVVAATYLHDFVIDVVFNDGKTKRIDCKKYLQGEIFKELHDKEKFKNFFVDGYTISWPNGADIAPETLYLDNESNQVTLGV
ncbi:DUF2442 domain-containing protein [Desulfovulcanus sp.]